eukprot:g3181.t1
MGGLGFGVSQGNGSSSLFLSSLLLCVGFVCAQNLVREDDQNLEIVVEAARPLQANKSLPQQERYAYVNGSVAADGQTYVSALEVDSKLKAGPDDDNEAEISGVFVKIEAVKGKCQINGSMWNDYNYRSGKFSSQAIFLGDDTVGIGFYTKGIRNLTSQQYSNHSKIQVKKRATTRCKSVIMWEFPEIIAPPVVTNRYRLDWWGDLGVIQNGSNTFNEIVYSTGYSNRLAIKRIFVEIKLPKAFKKKELKIFGPNLVNETGSTYDEKTGIVKFQRHSYLAPMNRYTVRVWFPVGKDTKDCFSCAREESKSRV